jgi:adenosylcobinamide amidohydrolase
MSISSASYGGGLQRCRWVLNAQVRADYSCDEPGRDIVELARLCRVAGPGVGLLTGVDVRVAATAVDDGVTIDATVGMRPVLWAAAPDTTDSTDSTDVAQVGTINIVGFVPERLTDAAMVNAVATVTEAKVQALHEAGYDGTGTPTDAVCLVCPADGPAHQYGGPRSRWGAPLARAVRQAVLDGIVVDRSLRTSP